MKVGLLTTQQKEIIEGQLFAPNSYFNPIQDINDNWIISQEEINNCIYDEYNFVKTLPLIDYIPKPVQPF